MEEEIEIEIINSYSRKEIGMRSIPEIPICLNCKTKIPFLSLFVNDDGIINLNIRCNCEEKIEKINLSDYNAALKSIEIPDAKCPISIHANNKIKVYCTNNCSWLCEECIIFEEAIKAKHIHFKHELNLYCKTHFKKLKVFCTTCNSNICKICHNTNHTNHRVITPFIDKTLDLSVIEELMNQYKKIYDSFMEEIDKKINKYKKYKQCIQNLYKQNEQQNNQIIELLHIINNTITKTQTLYNNEMKTTLQRIMFNNTNTMQIIPDKIKTNFTQLQTFFKTNFILIITKEDSLVEILSESNGISSIIVIDENKIASCSQSNEIKIWNINDCNTPLATLEHTDQVNCVVLIKHNILASGSNDQTIKIWDIDRKKCMNTYTNHETPVTLIVKLQDNFFGTCSKDIAVAIWVVDQNNQCEMICKFKFNGIWIRSLIQLDNEEVFIGTSAGELIVQKINYDYIQNKYKKYHSSTVNGLLQLKDNRLVSCSVNGQIKIWTKQPFTLIHTIEIQKMDHDNNKPEIIGLCQLLGDDLAALCSDNVITAWDLLEFGISKSFVADHSIILYVLKLDSQRHYCSKCLQSNESK